MDELNIKVLGTRAGIYEHRPWYSKHSGILVDSTLLFDVGEKEYLTYRPLAIFITHLHPDHAFFFEQKAGPIECPVYAPEKCPSRPDVQVLKSPVVVGEFLVTPIPTVHSHEFASQGYLIEGKGKRLLYTGDMINIRPHRLRKLGELDVVITEASYFRHGGMVRHFDAGDSGHNGLRELIELFSPFTKRIIFVHFGTWFMRDTKSGRKRILSLSNRELKLEVAHDGKEFLI